MYVRKKLIHGKPRHSLVESYRDKATGRPRQRTLAYLGQHETLEKRLAFYKKQLRTWRRLRTLSLRDLRGLDESDAKYPHPRIREWNESRRRRIKRREAQLTKRIDKAESFIARFDELV
jgi:hypothetical protein